MALAWQVKRFILWVFAKKCFVQEILWCHLRIMTVCPYLVFVTTQASLLVKKANEILSTTGQ